MFYVEKYLKSLINKVYLRYFTMGQTLPFSISPDENIGTFSPTVAKSSVGGWISPYQKGKLVGGNEIAPKNSKPKLPEIDTNTESRLRQAGFTTENILAFLEWQKKQIIGQTPSAGMKDIAPPSPQVEGVAQEVARPMEISRERTVLRPRYKPSHKKYRAPVLTETPEENRSAPAQENIEPFTAPEIEVTTIAPPENNLVTPDQAVKTAPQETETSPSIENTPEIIDQTKEPLSPPRQLSPETKKVAVEKLLGSFRTEEGERWTDYITPFTLRALDSQKKTSSWRDSLGEVPEEFIQKILS